MLYFFKTSELVVMVLYCIGKILLIYKFAYTYKVLILE